MIVPESTHMLFGPLANPGTVNVHVLVEPAATCTLAGTLAIVVFALGEKVPLIFPVFPHVTVTTTLDGHVPPVHGTLHGVGQADGPLHVIHDVAPISILFIVISGSCIFTVIHWLTILLFPPIFIIVYIF